ncbi:3-hydroxyacyl-CoA dehydrogenase NAD-binding domain-containing protein [Lysinibacillus boronitolerans]|uniref:3-hydroxyacyl-CoA dehydrogenase family protein n=1 Tax=Lysinibacillus boronitolerans TaxID=309788 RepID=UPI002161C19F|nr:3-hydroxyacyl-CoA dehydrogenase NAD-binding domain-containing protein [Lysinibacillus boronitolerans]MCS1392292.1 3-hydroxyacyl-CoA dehydrogenase NAD-binding domain-containing protein [Lysinibacillus boronitolerans]
MERQVMVVGAGLMGSGIAQVFALSGFKVLLTDRTEDDLNRGRNYITKSIQSMLKKEKYTVEDEKRIHENIDYSSDIQLGKNVDLVIEAVPEKLAIKQEVFKMLDTIVQPNAILASNTSSLSIAAIGSVTRRPEKVIGLHFFSPVPIMRLLEIVTSIETSEETLNRVQFYGKKINKESVIAQDYPGFIVNRILLPMMNEAAFLVMEGTAPEEVDRGLMLGANHPIGPLRLADQCGLDTTLYALESLYEGFSDSKYRPCPLLKRMVEAGHLGRKSGKGFYDY